MGRHSAYLGRRLTRYEQLLERAAASPVGAWMFVHVLHHVDRRLLPLTHGRASSAPGAPVGLLETVGARTGKLRRTPLLYVADGEDVIVVASNGGAAAHPAWLHNLRARPDVRFLAREDGWRARRARVATGVEADRLWARATDLYAGYAAYERRAGGRSLPVVVLEPAPVRDA